MGPGPPWPHDGHLAPTCHTALLLNCQVRHALQGTPPPPSPHQPSPARLPEGPYRRSACCRSGCGGSCHTPWAHSAACGCCWSCPPHTLGCSCPMLTSRPRCRWLQERRVKGGARGRGRHPCQQAWGRGQACNATGSHGPGGNLCQHHLAAGERGWPGPCLPQSLLTDGPAAASPQGRRCTGGGNTPVWVKVPVPVWVAVAVAVEVAVAVLLSAAHQGAGWGMQGPMPHAWSPKAHGAHTTPTVPPWLPKPITAHLIWSSRLKTWQEQCPPGAPSNSARRFGE